MKWAANPVPHRDGKQRWRVGPLHHSPTDESGVYAGALIVLCVAAFLALPFVPDYLDTGAVDEQRVYLWCLGALILALILILLGARGKGVWVGSLLDRENRLDLARLQVVTLTIILLSAIHTTLFSNLRASGRLSMSIPTEVWLLLGIHIATLTCTSVILGTKRAAPPMTQQEEARHGVLVINDGFGGQKRVANDGKTEVVGVLVTNSEPKDWSWSDLFLGVEVGNQRSVDIGKVQMFFFSAIVFTAYVALLIQTLGDSSAPLVSLPGFSDSLLTVIVISHAGYLANLAAPHTDTD